METATKWPSGGTSSTATFMRDEKSRTRVDQGGISSINDPVSGKSFLLSPANKIAIPGQPAPPAMPGVPAKPSTPSQPSVAMPGMPQPTQTADLGKKVINGIPVEGKQFSIPSAPAAPAAPGKPATPAAPSTPGMPTAPAMPKPPLTAEVWTSSDLKLPIHSTVTDPSTGMTTVTQMKNVQSGAKIDPSKFQIPADYKIVAPKAPAVPPSPLKS
jgi:hypothetical protein